MTIPDSKRVSRIILGCLMAIAILYASQGVILHIKLQQLNSTKIDISKFSEQCDEQNCTGQWQIQSEKKFLLLGHILRTHILIDTETGDEIFPISKGQGTASDSWQRVMVYQVKPGHAYTLNATKPKSSKLDYFVGILPRATDSNGIIGVTDIGPTTSLVTALVSSFFLLTVFGSAVIGRGNISASTHLRHKQLFSICISAALLTVTVFTSLGVLNSLLPEGNFRNMTLRILTFTALILPLLAQPYLIGTRHFPMKTFLITLGLLTVGFQAWPFLRVGTYWALTLALVSAFGIIGFLKTKEYAAAIMWSSAVFDACKISGLVTIPDYPPVYFFNVFSLLALTIIAGNRGGFSTIAMASVAYRRFKRDILLSAIKETLRMEASSETSKKIYELSQLLPDIANLTHAGRVSITVNLPLGRPIIQTYDRDANSTTIHDDGKIPGAVTLRTLIYGDTAIFESFDQFTKKLKLIPNPQLQDSRIFCALPLSVDNTIIGSIMLTKFNDDYLEGTRLRGGNLTEERENLTVLVTTLSQSLSSLMVRDLNSYSIISKSLHKAVHREIALSNNSEDFLHRYANCLAEACSAQVIIHGRVKDQGIALAHSGLPDDAWKFFCENPLNLNPDSASSFGPTVVAFIDGKSNFVKDIGEIWDRLHPKTQLVFARMNVRGIAAVPLLSSERLFVATIVKPKDESYVDPAIVQVIESTEVLFTAANEVMSQKSSVLALGELASRLIGDADVRNKIIAAAKAQNLPTTIGSPKTSFLLLFDLAGSSDLSEDTEIKARAYGRFYDAVNTKSQDLLNGSIRKTIGDAIIITWDGSTTTPSDEPNFLEKLEFLTHYADSIARSIGCKGSRALLHYGSYFLGLVGTKTFGQIDVIGSGIDEVCKMEGLMKGIAIDGFPIKLAISERAVSELTTILLNEYTDRNYQIIENSDHAKMKLHFAKTLSHKLEVKRDVA